MDASDFIVPPPGIVPDPPRPPAETVRASRPVERTLPTFAPGSTGAPPPAFAVPSTPPRPAGPGAATAGDQDAAALEATGERVRWRLAAPTGADLAVLGPSVVLALRNAKRMSRTREEAQEWSRKQREGKPPLTAADAERQRIRMAKN